MSELEKQLNRQHPLFQLANVLDGSVAKTNPLFRSSGSLSALAPTPSPDERRYSV